MDFQKNPFTDDTNTPTDQDRYDIWEMLVNRDIHAFVNEDWGMVADDFIADSFTAVHAQFSSNPDTWTTAFATLEAYKIDWLRQASETAQTEFAEPLLPAIFRATRLRDIDISDTMAIAHKKFDGTIAKADGTKDVLSWQTLYYCRKVNGQWKIAGFTGYMPHPMG